MACKEWNGLESNKTKQTGTHQNPPDLNPLNYKLVRFSEHRIDGRVVWNFFPDQCRHCVSPPCMSAANFYVEGAVVQDPATGAVLYTDLTRHLSDEAFQEMREACPYNIPRRNTGTGLVSKCTMCFERVRVGMLPMCVKTCAMGAMNFGERADMVALAKKRLAEARKEWPDAQLGEVDDVSVIYLMAYKPELFFEHAVAQAPAPLSRKNLLAKAARPVKSLIQST